MKLSARDDLAAPSLSELVALDDRGFRDKFAGSPIKRIGHARFVRNVLIAIGNSGDRSLLEAAQARLGDPEPLIRGAAVWAVRRLAASGTIHKLRLAFLPAEADMSVRAEWAAEVPPA